MKKLLSLLLALLLVGCGAEGKTQNGDMPANGEETSQMAQQLPKTLEGGEVLIMAAEGAFPETLPQDFLRLSGDAGEQLWQEMAPWEWEWTGEEASQETPLVTLTIEGGSREGLSTAVFPNGQIRISDGTGEEQYFQGTTVETLLIRLEQIPQPGEQYLEPERTMEEMLSGEVQISALGRELKGNLGDDPQTAQQLREALNLQGGWEFLSQEPEQPGTAVAQAEGSDYQVCLYQKYASIAWKDQPCCWFRLPDGLILSLTMGMLSLNL